jgi:hypothetical protein
MNYTKEQLGSKTLSEILRVYVQANNLATEKNQLEYLRLIEGVILNNFTEKPMVRLHKAILEVDAMNLPDKVKRKIKETKYCAANICDHLDPIHMGSMTSLKKIVSELIATSKAVIENTEFVEEEEK